MSNFLDEVVADVGKVIDVFGKAPLTPTEAAATVAGKITVSDLRGALSVAKALPYSELEALLTGQGTVDQAFDVTEQVVSLIATTFPPAIPQAVMIQMVLKLANAGYDLARARGVTISPGQGDLSYENDPNFKNR